MTSVAMHSNLHEVVYAIGKARDGLAPALSAELDVLAQEAARRMRALAPKWRTTLTNSIHVNRPALLVREIRPGTDYAEAVERGVRPGGKGLPRFFDPASRSIVEWLESKAFAGQGRVRRDTARFTARELDLRDRYEGLAWHVRTKGIKAHPFVEPTAKEMEPVVLQRLDAAVARVMRLNLSGGAT